MSDRPANLTPLPRGRHKLSADAVRASQRERLIEAILQLAAERGYARTSVPEVVARARVSRNAFYELFDDKADCFTSACTHYADLLLARMTELAAAPTWVDALADGMDVYLRWWQEVPHATAAFLIELPAAGHDALAVRDRLLDRFEAMFTLLAARARHEDPALPPLAPLAPRLLVAGINELITRVWREGRPEDLDALREPLLHHAVRVLSG